MSPLDWPAEGAGGDGVRNDGEVKECQHQSASAGKRFEKFIQPSKVKYTYKSYMLFAIQTDIRSLNVFLGHFNPTPVGGGVFRPPTEKWQ